nr:hypothetical protein Itr_chr05CG22010 [Ipomoea trifida]
MKRRRAAAQQQKQHRKKEVKMHGDDDEKKECTENFVDGGEFVGFVGGKVGRKGTFLSAATAQKLTGGARSDGV